MLCNVSLFPHQGITLSSSTLILGDPQSAVQTRSKVTKSSGAHAFVSYIQKQGENNHKVFLYCLFCLFLVTNEPKKISKALEDESWVDAMQEELLQFRIQKVWILVDLPYGNKAIGTKWVYRNKKDVRGVVVRNKARIEAIRIFLAFASYMGFIVYQMDVKSAFLYGKIDEEVYMSQPLGFIDPKYPKKVYKVVKALYGLHQAPRSWFRVLPRGLPTKCVKRILGRLISLAIQKQTNCGSSTTEARIFAAAIVWQVPVSLVVTIGRSIPKLHYTINLDKGNDDQTEARSATPITSTTTPTMFRDDETIAQVLLNMSQAKAVSREKLIQKIKERKIEEEESLITESEDILEAEKSLNLKLKEDFLQTKGAIAIRTNPTTRNQLRNQMMTYLMHVGNKKLTQTEDKTLKKYKLCLRQVFFRGYDESFTAVGSTEDVKRIKEMNEGVKDSDQKRLKEEDTVKVPAKVEVTEQGTKKRKGGHIKMIARKKLRKQSDVDSDDEHRKCLRSVAFEGTINSEIMEKKSFIARLNKVSSPYGDYLIIYRANGNFRAFNYLMENLKMGGTTVIHMLVERRYPLSKELLQRMLDLGLEVKRESTVALDLIRFIKKQMMRVVAVPWT
ncbi:putative ribonuclease H-like domain-containing protein [Tanacetum coccineum]